MKKSRKCHLRPLMVELQRGLSSRCRSWSSHDRARWDRDRRRTDRAAATARSPTTARKASETTVSCYKKIRMQPVSATNAGIHAHKIRWFIPRLEWAARDKGTYISMPQHHDMSLQSYRKCNLESASHCYREQQRRKGSSCFYFGHDTIRENKRSSSMFRLAILWRLRQTGNAHFE